MHLIPLLTTWLQGHHWRLACLSTIQLYFPYVLYCICATTPSELIPILPQDAKVMNTKRNVPSLSLEKVCRGMERMHQPVFQCSHLETAPLKLTGSSSLLQTKSHSGSPSSLIPTDLGLSSSAASVLAGPSLCPDRPHLPADHQLEIWAWPVAMGCIASQGRAWTACYYCCSFDCWSLCLKYSPSSDLLSDPSTLKHPCTLRVSISNRRAMWIWLKFVSVLLGPHTDSRYFRAIHIVCPAPRR